MPPAQLTMTLRDFCGSTGRQAECESFALLMPGLIGRIASVEAGPCSSGGWMSACAGRRAPGEGGAADEHGRHASGASPMTLARCSAERVSELPTSAGPLQRAVRSDWLLAAAVEQVGRPAARGRCSPRPPRRPAEAVGDDHPTGSPGARAQPCAQGRRRAVRSTGSSSTSPLRCRARGWSGRWRRWPSRTEAMAHDEHIRRRAHDRAGLAEDEFDQGGSLPVSAASSSARAPGTTD